MDLNCFHDIEISHLGLTRDHGPLFGEDGPTSDAHGQVRESRLHADDLLRCPQHAVYNQMIDAAMSIEP